MKSAKPPHVKYDSLAPSPRRGDIKEALEDQFRAAFLLGCVGAWSLHPVQIDIARKDGELRDAYQFSEADLA